MGEQQTDRAAARKHGETRQERRERKLVARRERMHKHGASLGRIYADAILKRLKKK